MADPKTADAMISATDVDGLAHALVQIVGPGAHTSCQIADIPCFDKYGLYYGTCTVIVKKDKRNGN